MSYSSDQQDEMTRTAQTVLRLMGHGAVKEILGLDGQDVPGRAPVAQCAGHCISTECPTLLLWDVTVSQPPNTSGSTQILTSKGDAVFI